MTTRTYRVRTNWGTVVGTLTGAWMADGEPMLTFEVAQRARVASPETTAIETLQPGDRWSIPASMVDSMEATDVE